MKKNVQMGFVAALLLAISVDVSCGNETKTSAKETAQVSNVDSLNIGVEFIPAGYMGCIKGIDINPAFTVNPHSGETCYKIEYKRDCFEGFAGVYWTNRDADGQANWGQYPGSDLSNAGYTKVTFWARGDKGGEFVDFGSGGVSSGYKFKDSYPTTYTTKGKTVSLTKEWQQFTIDLKSKNLSSIIGAFFWAAKFSDNPMGLVFYLDDIYFE